MTKTRTFTVALSTAIALGWGTAGAGEDMSYPSMNVGVSFELENDNVFDSDDPANEINDLYTTTEAAVRLDLLPGLFIESGMVLEPVLDPMPFEDRAFEDHGLYVESLIVGYENGPVFVYAGKFGANFGTAWDLAPGVFGTSLAEDYELTERLGFGGAYAFETESAGTHTVSASVFQLDRSLLSNSLITERGRVHLSDGGPANTEGLGNFTVALDGTDIPSLPGFSYHAAFAYQDSGQLGEDTELGFVIGANNVFDVGNGIEVAPIVEFAYFDNAEAVWGQERYYITTGLAATYEAWSLALSYTGRHTTPMGGPSIDDRLFQVSAGYEFPVGLTADVGWAWMQDGGVDNYILGVLLTYGFETCVFNCGG